MKWIDDQYPAAIGKHRQTSDATDVYNCIAYAAGDQTEWWSHVPGYKWPSHRSPLIEALVGVYLSLGYAKSEPTDTALEPMATKVALYERRGFWKHAAMQKPNGKWPSKLGADEDIEHDDPECLCGEHYGKIHCIMRKART